MKQSLFKHRGSRPVQVGFGNATKKDVLQGPETRLQWTKRVLTEGHTFADAILTVSGTVLQEFNPLNCSICDTLSIFSHCVTHKHMDIQTKLHMTLY